MNIDTITNSLSSDSIDNSFSELSINVDTIPALYPPLGMPLNFTTSLHEALLDIRSNNYQNELAGLIAVRRLLSVAVHPPTQEVVKTNICPVLISMVYSRPRIFAIQVCLMLGTIASGNSKCIKYIMDINSLEFFNQVFDLDPNSFTLQDHIVLAVGNIAGDSVLYRNAVNNSEVCKKILKYSEILPANMTAQYQNLLFALSNFILGRPHVRGKLLETIRKFFQKALFLPSNENYLEGICWGLARASKDSDDFDEHTPAVLEKIAFLCICPSQKFTVPALKVLGNFLLNCQQSWLTLSCSVVVCAILLGIQSERTAVRKEAMRVASIVCLDSLDAITSLIDAGFYTIAHDLIENEEGEVVDEIIYTIIHTAYCCSQPQAEVIFKTGWIQRLLQVFMNTQEKIKCTILGGLNFLFEKYPSWFDTEFGKEIENLGESGNLSNKAIRSQQELLHRIHEFQN